VSIDEHACNCACSWSRRNSSELLGLWRLTVVHSPSPRLTQMRRRAIRTSEPWQIGLDDEQRAEHRATFCWQRQVHDGVVDMERPSTWTAFPEKRASRRFTRVLAAADRCTLEVGAFNLRPIYARNSYKCSSSLTNSPYWTLTTCRWGSRGGKLSFDALTARVKSAQFTGSVLMVAVGFLVCPS